MSNSPNNIDRSPNPSESPKPTPENPVDHQDGTKLLEKNQNEQSQSANVTAPTSQSIQCPSCGHLNRAGELICSNCQASIDTNIAISTKKFNENNAQEIAERHANAATDEKPQRAPLDIAAIMSAVDSAHSDIFNKGSLLRLEVESAPNPILIYPRAETSIGRRDPTSGLAPDVDLTNYAGYRMGVSRNHCIMRLREQKLEVYDLGSSNGTLLNGERLQPHQPKVIRDGDELMLGKMVLKVIFERKN